MGSDGGLREEFRRRHNLWLVGEGQDRCWFGQSDIPAVLFEVSFCGGDRLREMLADEGGCEAWPGGEETVVDCLCPCFDNWAEAGAVQVCDKVAESAHFVYIVSEVRWWNSKEAGGGW